MENSELRFRARQTLGGKLLKDRWMYPLLVLLLAGIVSSILTSFVFGIVLLGFITYGTSKYFLSLSRGTISHDNLMIVTEGIKGDAIGNMLIELLRTIFVLLWSLLFIIPGIIKSYSYSMAYYIKIDHPEYTATQAITESRRLMDGNKFKLFMLDLSFIGWIILGTLCFGIGILWVDPYIQCAHAEFYRDLVGG